MNFFTSIIACTHCHSKKKLSIIVDLSPALLSEYFNSLHTWSLKEKIVDYCSFIISITARIFQMILIFWYLLALLIISGLQQRSSSWSDGIIVKSCNVDRWIQSRYTKQNASMKQIILNHKILLKKKSMKN